jgi:hypothetical protein
MHKVIAYYHKARKGNKEMTRERKLKAEAMESAIWRGHAMPRKWQVIAPGRVFAKTCEVCGREVWVELQPAPNSITISGEAVAIHCR